MASATSGSGPVPLDSQVHAAAVNGDRSALVRLITADPSLKDHGDQFGRTPLMYCVLADRLCCAKILLKAGASVNKTDSSQRTALHLAAQKLITGTERPGRRKATKMDDLRIEADAARSPSGNVRFLKLLLSRRADCLQKDQEGMTPLHLATRHPSPKALALLLKHVGPGEVDTQDNNKQTALHWSAFFNRPEHVRLLIKHDSNIGIPDSEGKIPLHWAAHSQEASATQTVRCILEAAPTESLLNWQDYEGRTPLHFAVADGNEAVVKVLTSYEGCNVTAYDNLFRTPLHWAALLGHAKIVHLLLERNTSGTIPSDSQGATPLHYGAQKNNAETVGVFLSHPSVKDEPDLEGRTAFMWAAGKGSDDVIRTMLALVPRIDTNMADKYGGTALHAASLSGHVSTVKLLLENGATVDSLDVMKHTPLFRACEMGYKDVILTLIKGGARVGLVDVDGHTALHWAALGGNAEVCQILMENGIGPNVQDHAGRTPLQCAAYGGYITCMAVLLENNADPNVQDKEGRTALHWSCNNGYLDAVKLLLGYNAFPNQMEHTEERYTPLDYALLGGHSEVTQFMLEHGALSIAAIQDIAAASIQAVYKGYTVRKAFRERKQLLMRHEQLRKDAAAKKREEEQRRREAVHRVSTNAADKRRVSLVKAEQEKLASMNINDSLETKKSSKGERTKTKEERHTAHKSRMSRRRSTAERAEAPEALSCDTDVSQTTRLDELLSPSVCRELKPTPPSWPRVRDRSSSNTSAPSPPVSALEQSEAGAGDCIPLKKRDGRSSRTHASLQKHRNRREQASERAFVKDQTASLRSNSSLQRQQPSGGAQAGNHTITREQQDGDLRRNEAARILQQAWLRFRARRRRELKDRVEVESSDSSYKRKTESRVHLGKPGSKSSVLQNIYGSSVGRRGRSFHSPLDVPSRTQSQLSGLDCVHLTDALNQAKQYSYHLRPHSAGQGARGRGKH
ncbi:inversin [Austrofundulus limnaeus]|uniref:Inversin n=1 Tax=Austrofundulus limnaeus TaxID=52670 RepID=A0A2I4AXG5_AUSLI|nr:PREDICTED: inversin [Austrofundulus limnaeus]XP_013860193.1 PREDICTED: inversin [Austrofundulus limnaeus]XP_013860194.1 PREDICTED: inversin [Austrofundulus limnaeus]XP_013860195.1 PREDICTED: inversin [Austrofundulus limnaeus]